MKVLKSETFLRHLALTLLVAMLAAAHTVQAQDSYPDYISEVMVVGYGSEKTVSDLESLFPGWKAVDYNLNKGAYGDDIYLIYKTASRNNTNGGYITDFIVSDVENPSDNLTYNGRTYHLCPYDGYQTFTAQKGDLNRGAQGKYVYLYYTRDNFSDNKRAVTGISFDATSSNAVQLQCTTCQSGTTTYKEADFNRGALPGSSPHIYMHITTTPKSNRPSSDPKMASGLTYNGKSQALLSINNTNTGTMMYSVNDGSFSSTIPTATDAGDYTVKYYAASDGYGDKSETKSQIVSIAKATNNKVTTTEALDLTYNGSAQNLITAYSATFGTVEYSLDGTNYSTTVPKGTDAKTYTIYYKVAETPNYNGVSGTATAKINKAANSVTTTEALNLTYNGSAQKLITAYSATFGDILYSLDNTTFSSDIPQATDAKDYTIYYKVEGTSNYNGVSGEATAKINKAANSNATVSIANSIDGREKVKPTVTNNLSTGTITYQYSTSPNSVFSTTKPNTPGTWYVKATIAADDNCEAYTTDTQNFTLIDWEGDGTSSSPYLIKSTTDLDRLATKVYRGNSYNNKYFKLCNDITYSYENLGETERNFTAIGDRSHQFQGTFDGGNNNGYTISGIRIKASDGYQGLFGWVGGYATIQNVTLEDAKITCYGGYVGGIAGENYGTISNCTSSATVSAVGDNLSYYGGIVGKNDGTLTNNLAIDAVTSSISPSSDYHGAIAGDNKGTLQNNFYYNITVKGATSNVGCNGADIDDNNGAVSVHTITLCDGLSITSAPSITYAQTNYYAKGTVLKLQKNIATTYYANGEEISGETFTMPDKNVTFTRALVINGDNGANLIINENKDNQTIVFRRSFRKDITATVILPFGFKASDYFEGKGTFHTLDNVEYNEQAKQWEAKASQAIPEIKANTPYIFKPTADLEEIIFTGVDVKANTGLSKEQAPIEISSETNSKDWTLVGVYTKKVWDKRTPTEYGFASVADGDIAAGEFVRAGAGAWVNPTRCYLKYSGTEESLISKSSVKLPEKIVLIFPDKNDIVMPVSEIIPNADVKVWSYEKTIFIQSKAGEKFKIVDMSGKTLKESVTQSDRDEITLNRNFSGIVIVRIGNRSFKIMY